MTSPFLREDRQAAGQRPGDTGAEGPRQSPIRRQLLDLYDVLSHKIAGGQRVDHRQMLPGADDPAEGVVPDDFRPEVTDLGRWFRPSEWLGVGPEDQVRADLGAIPEPAKGGVDGKGMDFFRGGEAPDNYTNRNNPLYAARREFAADINSRIEDLFDVDGGGVGWMRPPQSSDAAPGGRSANSDHYSGGAVDYYGDPGELDALRNWLVQQPFVSFVRWRSESHHDHLHASFDLGWVAQNYFQGRQVPSVQAPSAPRASQSPREPSTTRTRLPTSGAGRLV